MHCGSSVPHLPQPVPPWWLRLVPLQLHLRCPPASAWTSSFSAWNPKWSFPRQRSLRSLPPLSFSIGRTWGQLRVWRGRGSCCVNWPWRASRRRMRGFSPWQASLCIQPHVELLPSSRFVPHFQPTSPLPQCVARLGGEGECTSSCWAPAPGRQRVAQSCCPTGVERAKEEVTAHNVSPRHRLLGGHRAAHRILSWLDSSRRIHGRRHTVPPVASDRVRGEQGHRHPAVGAHELAARCHQFAALLQHALSLHWRLRRPAPGRHLVFVRWARSSRAAGAAVFILHQSCAEARPGHRCCECAVGQPPRQLHPGELLGR